jgi:hydroxymethylpyrimidine/phosphomethylpyrimidine kinase
MSKRFRRLPVALTVAGSDSGGGAGIQADLKTFAALGVHGASVITCVTAQNPRGVLGIQACRPGIVRQQLEAVWAELPPPAMKTGMLYSREIIRTVAAFLKRIQCPPLVVDPVMISTSGKRLLQTNAINALADELLPLAALVTPNLDEAAILTGGKVRTVEEMRAAAREIRRRFGCAALVKGGHLKTGREAVDVFFDGKDELLLTAPRVKGIRTHGTGCAYSAAITAHLALGLDLLASVVRAKEFISRAIAGSRQAGRHWVLNFNGV